jgi:hypothetical protein
MSKVWQTDGLDQQLQDLPEAEVEAQGANHRSQWTPTMISITRKIFSAW